MVRWKDRCVDMLRDLGLQRAACESIPLELKRLELEGVAIRCAATDGVTVKSSGRQDRMLWNLVQREDLERNLQMAKQYVAFVERGLGALDPQEARTLERVYVLGERDVIEHLREEWAMMEKRSVYKRLDRILYRLTVAMYGMEVS
ncbi:MAG: hypothetical protein IJW45_04705 [Oscillospiraceae bacterium]|nr:hypothetical protein [Oscillospiraceae bacterium]